MMRHLSIACIALLAMIAPAAADYQVTGRFLYTDREFDLNGFTGNDPDRPIRLADVQVVDNSTQQVLASGATDLNGDFSIPVTDNQTRNIVVRALTSSGLTPDLHITVRHRDNNGIYAISHPVFSSHSPTQDIDFSGSPVVAEPAPTSVGDAFNIFDVTLDGMDFVATQEGTRPGASLALTLFWAVGNGNGTFYSHGSRSIFLVGVLGTDSDGYDDAVILHELGHYVEFNIGDSDNTGGSHAVNLCNNNNNLPLAWSEGWSTFFQNMVRDWQGLSGADTYVDTDGRSSGSGGAFLSYTVESFGFSVDMGSANEATVNAVLWDIVDDAGTQDSSPGSDDDAFQLADGVSRFWDVFTNYFPTATTISIEDFFDGWLSRGHGMDTELRALFALWSMEFSDDAFESDDNVGQARSAGVTGGTTHHTVFGAGDEDWTRFDGVQGSSYDFQTDNLPCGANTRLELRDSNGTTILASNDAPENNPDSINWVATKNGDLYLRVTRAGDGHAYASYDLVVGIVLPVTITDFSSESTADGLRLQWHGEADNGFSHFDIERGDAIEGPFAQRNSEPIVADVTDPTLYGYVDGGVEPGREYFYRIVGVEDTGARQAFGPYRATAAAPARLVLFPARPNPFNPNTVLSFDLPRAGVVHLRIFNIAGRHVRTLVNGATMPVGTRSVFWDGRDAMQRRVASGVYVVQLDSLGDRQVQRVVLVR